MSPWTTNSQTPLTVPHVKVTAAQKRRQGCCCYCTHPDPSPDVHNSKGSMSSLAAMAGVATEPFTALFYTNTTMNSPGRPEKFKEMLKTWWKAFLFQIISSIEKTAIAFININMEFPYSDPIPIWNGERVTHGYNPGFLWTLSENVENYAHGNFNTLRFR